MPDDFGTTDITGGDGATNTGNGSINWLGWLSAIGTGVGIFNLFSTGSKREKREKKQVGVLKEHFADVESRTPEIEAFYDSLRDFSEQGTELSRQGASQDFISRAFKLGQAESEGIRQSGLVQSSTQDIEVARELESRETTNVLDLIEQGRQGELLRIGKAEQTELQSIEDLLFGIKSEILGKGGKVGDLDSGSSNGSSSGDTFDYDTAYQEYIDYIAAGGESVRTAIGYEPGWLKDWWEDQNA